MPFIRCRRISLYPTFVALSVTACSANIYLQEGLTDGDTFYLAQQALTNDDPVMQSWVRYSLSLSTCQLQIGGNNPARATSFDCEWAARRSLVDSWGERHAEDAGLRNRYLDDLTKIRDAGFLREYVASQHRRREWTLPDDLDMRAFRRWQRLRLHGHKPETRLIGSWNYASDVRCATYGCKSTE